MEYARNGRQGANRNHTIIAKTVTSATPTTTIRSLLRVASSFRRGGLGGFVGIIGLPLRLIARTDYRRTHH